MHGDPAARGSAVILFGLAVMNFGAIAGDATAAAVIGLIIAIAGVLEALFGRAAR